LHEQKVYNRSQLSPVTTGLLLAQTTKAIQTFRWVLKRSVEVGWPRALQSFPRRPLVLIRNSP
jgi:hypothetical protein